MPTSISSDHDFMLNPNHRLAYITISIALLILFQLLNISSLAADTPALKEKPDFNTLKQNIMNRLKTELACVEMASDQSALNACRPQPPSGRPGPRNPATGGTNMAPPNNLNDPPEF